MFSISEICSWTDGVLAKDGDLDSRITAVSTDTRTITPGALFVALRGDVFDGHQFLSDAEKAGAAACLVEKVSDDISIPQIVVPDTLKALQSAARTYRQRELIPVVAVTGSNGKTTTKNFIAAILMKKFKVAYTKGNFNNHIGLPLSILSIKKDDEVAVFEVGTNHPGEIKFLADMCKPTVVVITNIGVAHIEYFGSKEAIAKEKGELPAALPESGLFIVPAQDEFASMLSGMTKARSLKVSEEDSAYAGIAAEMRKIRTMAPHVIQDALLAAAVGKYYEISDADIVDALSHTKNDEGRFTLKQVNGIGVIDDTYNANPDSVCAAIRALNALYPDRRKIIALGKLMEQGEFLEKGYERIIDAAKDAGLAKIIFVDIPYESPDILHVKDQKECAVILKSAHAEGDIILIKGSKSAEMGRVIDFL